METRVRFAPSPTGQVHIGNIRTAIFNWLFARNENGKFLVRVEDTDLERSTQEAIDKLFECMQWLGLDFDEDAMFQSKAAENHLDAAKKLLDAKQAYYAPAKDGEDAPMLFRIPCDNDDISIIRTVGPAQFAVHSDEDVKIDWTGISFAQISKKGKPVPMSACLAGFSNLKIYDTHNHVIFELDENLNDILENQKSFTFANCAKFEWTRKEVFYKDIIKGELSKPLDSMKDLVIVRSNGSPIFHLANVCDDMTQKVTHIVRGDDHIENTYRHILLFDALGFDIPQYAHMPMITNKQGKPYSKRDGDAFVGDFKDAGYLPEALFNYISLLGWSPGDDREKMTKDELISAFSLERVQSSPAQLDHNKLQNMNAQYISEIPSAQFAELALSGIEKEDWGQNIDGKYFAQVAEMMQPRTKLITQLDSWKFFFSEDFEYNEKAKKKQFKKEEIQKGTAQLAEKFAQLADFTADNLEKIMRETESACELGDFKLNQPLRIAITGTNGGPDLNDVIMLLGKDKVIARINKLLENL